MQTASEASQRGRANKRKGKDFERRVGHLICDALGLEYGRDIARDVLSGGGVWKGDLHPITPKAQDMFPFVTECKYHQDWTWNQFLAGNGKLYGWLDKLVVEAKEVTKVRKASPLLIVSKPRELIYVCSSMILPKVYPTILLRYQKQVWMATTLDNFLVAFSRKRNKNR